MNKRPLSRAGRPDPTEPDATQPGFLIDASQRRGLAAHSPDGGARCWSLTPDHDQRVKQLFAPGK